MGEDTFIGMEEYDFGLTRNSCDDTVFLLKKGENGWTSTLTHPSLNYKKIQRRRSSNKERGGILRGLQDLK